MFNKWLQIALGWQAAPICIFPPGKKGRGEGEGGNRIVEGDFGHLGGYIWAFLISFWDIGCFLDVFEKFLGQQRFFWHVLVLDILLAWGNISRKENKNLILNSENKLNQATQEIQDPSRNNCAWKIQNCYKIILLIFYKFSRPHTTSTKG